jgi:hypothetical protein
MNNNIKYDFSFTAISLRVVEMSLVAKYKYDKTEFDVSQEIGKGKSSTAKRFLSTINKRLGTLTRKQLEILANGDRTQQTQVALLSVCKAHRFLRDFIIEVVREKFLIYDYQLTEGEYIGFYRRKVELYPEMSSYTDSTQYKVKQVTFKILAESGIIDSVKNRTIQAQVLDSQVIEAMSSDDKKWLSIFLWSDLDINNL